MPNATTPLATEEKTATIALTQPAAAETRKRLSKQARRTLLHIGTLIIALLAWWAISAVGLVQPLFLPGPVAVWEAFLKANSCYPASEGGTRIICGAQNYFLWEHLLASLRRISIGVSLGIVFGVLLGFAMTRIRWFGFIVDPYLNFLRALPPLGYIGLLIVWFGIGDQSKLWLLFLASFPPITMATIAAVKGISESRIHALQALGGSQRQVLMHVILPSSLPGIIGGVRIATGLAWTTVVAAELNNGIPGIGGVAYLAGTQLQTPLVIASIIIIGLAAVALDQLIKIIGDLLVPWYGRA